MVEQDLEKKFKGKICKLWIPGYAPVYDKVEKIAVENITEPLIIVHMGNSRYEISPEDLEECLVLATIKP